MGSKVELDGDPGKILGLITKWAEQSGAINLGQGFPVLSEEEQQYPFRQNFLAQACEVLTDYADQQYKHPNGEQALRDAIAANDQNIYGIQTSPDTDILVTLGASNAIRETLSALIQNDDGRNEVLLIEPYFNFYHSIIRQAGGKAAHYSLEPDSQQNWVLDPEKLNAAITPQTKVILMNTPMNPTGKVFSKEELEVIADIVLRHNLYAVSDDVYEYFTTPEYPHQPLSTIPNMQERCIRVSSIGKSFSVTNWRVGYVVGPKDIIARMADNHFYTSCGVSGAFQNAATYGLGQADFLNSLGVEYREKSTLLADGLRQAGFLVSPPQGGYFVSASYANISNARAVDFIEHMINQHGVAAIPFDPTFIQAGNQSAAQYLRFCVAKPAETLRQAVQLLQGINGP